MEQCSSRFLSAACVKHGKQLYTYYRELYYNTAPPHGVAASCCLNQATMPAPQKSIPPMAIELATGTALSSADHGGGHGGGGGGAGGAQRGGGGHGSSSGGHGSGGHEGGYETPNAGFFWLAICFVGIMASFIVYGIVLEYATSGGRELHELSMIFLTSLMYSVTAYYGRYVNREVCCIHGTTIFGRVRV